MTRGGPARRALPCLLLLASVLLAFGRTAGHPFVVLDDPGYVTANPAVREGLTAGGIGWAFAATEMSNWHPLAWLSHMADVSLFGLDPAGHHAVNVLLHGAVALLLYRFLSTFAGSPGSALAAAALFALHPLRVEAVSWVAERKELLSALFLLAALHAYGSYARRPSPARYAAVAAAFSLALLSKPMAVTFPFLLLLADYWPLRRLPFSPPAPAGAGPGGSGDPPPRPALPRLLLEKVPLLLLSALSSFLTLRAQAAGGAVTPGDEILFSVRWKNALVSCASYLGKTVLPAGLGPYYPHPVVSGVPIAPWEWGGAALLLALLSALAVREGRRRPFLPFGWLWFLGTLVPVLGLVQVGYQSMADRYTYLPSMGLAVAVAWGVPSLLPDDGAWRRRAAAAAVAAAVALGAASFRQAGFWRSSSSLFERAVEAGGETAQSLHLLGTAYASEGRYAEGAAALERSLRLYSIDPRSWRGLAWCYEGLGRADEAEGALRQALRMGGGAPGDWEELARFGARTGRPGVVEEALRSLGAVDPAAAEGLAASLGLPR